MWTVCWRLRARYRWPLIRKFFTCFRRNTLSIIRTAFASPLAWQGVRLEAHVHVVTAALSATQNISKCVARCGLSVDELIMQPLAASYAVLTEDEKNLGVCLVDIGAGTTDIAVFTNGAIRHTACIPIAGDQVTNDIAVALRTPTQHAEEIKIKYACALEQLARNDESIQVPSVGDRTTRHLARQTLAQVVEARYRELFSLVQSELRRSGFENVVAAGLVMTGGASRIEGAEELAEEIFTCRSDLATPRYVTGLSDVVSNAIHATGVGLLLYGNQADSSRAPLRPAGEIHFLIVSGVGSGANFSGSSHGRTE